MLVLTIAKLLRRRISVEYLGEPHIRLHHASRHRSPGHPSRVVLVLGGELVGVLTHWRTNHIQPTLLAVGRIRIRVSLPYEPLLTASSRHVSKRLLGGCLLLLLEVMRLLLLEVVVMHAWRRLVSSSSCGEWILSLHVVGRRGRVLPVVVTSAGNAPHRVTRTRPSIL